VPPVNPPQPAPTQAPTQLIRLSREDFAASDIAAIGKRRADQAAAETAQNRNGTFGPGGGPNGARLYAAAWYREPRDAELRPFLPNGAPEGAWATIACQTVADYHVENCQEMDEFPLGSGLARGLRRAAWQFLVWPPRVDGKPQLGVWVRIRFDFTKNGKAPD
jgi:protein TonB